MTTVRAQCPACGDVKLRIDDLTVRVCSDESTTGAYRFRCPICDADRPPDRQREDRRPPRLGRGST